jgi:capsular polysaccharide biosynthesis protein
MTMLNKILDMLPGFWLNFILDYIEAIITVLFILGIIFISIFGVHIIQEEYADYIQLCQDNGYSELQCELRYKELQMSGNYETTYMYGE